MYKRIEMQIFLCQANKKEVRECHIYYFIYCARIMYACTPIFPILPLNLLRIRSKLRSLSMLTINQQQIFFEQKLSFLRHASFIVYSQYTKYVCIIMQNSNKSILSSPSLKKHHSQKQVVQIKILLVGDICVGKSSLIKSYKSLAFDQQYNSTFLEIHNAIIEYKQKLVKMNIWDLSGSQEYDTGRPLAYGNTDIFLICFSMVDLQSFYQALNKWLPQISKSNPHAKKIFVGTKKDIHEQQKELYEKKQICLRQNAMIGKIRQTGHRLVLCSAGVEESIHSVFHEAIEQYLQLRQKYIKKQVDCKLI